MTEDFETLRPDEALADCPGQPLVDAEAASLPPPRPTPTTPGLRRLLLGTSLVLIALNLRPVFSSVAALLPEILTGTGLQPWGGSLMTTLPVLCLGLFAPFAPRLAGRFGVERTILGLMVSLAVGTVLRGFGTVPALLGGAALSGASIAVVNVLLPGLVKRDFADRMALMTGLFTMALSAGAAAAAGLTVPVEHLLGGSWAMALAAWAVPVAAVILLWAPQAIAAPPHRQGDMRQKASLWRSRMAWHITFFMGTQSALAYCVFGYLAPMLRERGMDPVTAGLVVSYSVLLQCVSCLVAPAVAMRRRSQSLVNIAFFAVGVVGLLACMGAPLGGIWIWATLQGLGQGALIALAMTAIVLRTPDARMAAQLSSMSQSVGYTLASAGPLVVGLLRGWTGSYAASAILFVALGLFGSWSAYGAGRAVMIGRPEQEPGSRSGAA